MRSSSAPARSAAASSAGSGFVETWERGERWAMLALPPDRLPAGATAADDGANDGGFPEFPARRHADARSTRLRSSAGPTTRCCCSPPRNEEYAAGRRADAEQLYRRLLAVAPAHVAGNNNLANVLLDRGCAAAAAAAARAALAGIDRDPAVNGVFRGAVEETLARSLELESKLPRGRKIMQLEALASLLRAAGAKPASETLALRAWCSRPAAGCFRARAAAAVSREPPGGAAGHRGEARRTRAPGLGARGRGRLRAPAARACRRPHDRERAPAE